MSNSLSMMPMATNIHVIYQYKILKTKFDSCKFEYIKLFRLQIDTLLPNTISGSNIV